ncbi:dephospho-CoA kinase [Castellaniella sp. GW247-6E4]|uniref:dephospho-CoA kinase n=1 Tax=Castellaniella sp. GW247-6E4 TaxID=3140380 RepID=UPI0033147382
MFSVGLTGGIGSGKSQVADLLAEWGAAVVDTDRIAHALTAPGGEAIEAIRARFGAAAIGADGAMDRAWVRARVFEDPAARHSLEAILHPLIDRVTREQAARARGCYLVYVVPLLAESGRWRDRVDRICVVDCDPVTQVRRVQARSGLTRQAIERIMSVQASREERLAIADDVVLNDGSTSLDELVCRTRAIHDFWRARAACRSGGSSSHE